MIIKKNIRRSNYKNNKKYIMNEIKKQMMIYIIYLIYNKNNEEQFSSIKRKKKRWKRYE